MLQNRNIASFFRIKFLLRMVQLNYNLTHAHGSQVEKLQVNLHDVLQMGAGARLPVSVNPSIHKWHHSFDTNFLNALILTIIPLYELPMVLYLFTVVCES